MKSYLIGINSKYIHPAMGVFALVSNSKHPVLYDEFTIKDNKDKIINSIITKEYDVLGFSIYIWNSNIIKDILRTLKEMNFNKPIFIGGPETYFNSKLYIEQYNVKYVINDEGEDSFNELIDYLDGNINRYYVFSYGLRRKLRIRQALHRLPRSRPRGTCMPLQALRPRARSFDYPPRYGCRLHYD